MAATVANAIRRGMTTSIAEMPETRNLVQRDTAGGKDGGAGAVRKTRCKLFVSDYFWFVVLGRAVLTLYP